MDKRTLKILAVLVMLLIGAPLRTYAADDNLQGVVTISDDGTPQYGETISANISGITNNTGTLSYQWSRDGSDIDGQTAQTYTLVKADIGANIGVKVTSSVELGTLSSETVVVGKADREAPSAPTLQSKDHYNVMLTKVDGCEYKVSGGSFSASNTISSLKSNTEYTFYQRYAETDTHKASPASSGLNVTTDYVVLTDTSCNISTLKSGDGVLINGAVTLYGTQSIRVYCSSGASLTLKNATINVSSTSGFCAVEYAGSGKLILSGSNAVYSGSGRAGIETSGSLKISGSGSLYAKGGSNGAGIGGGNGEDGGSISLSGGIVYAASGSGGDDIGGGNSGSQGTLSISGSSAVFLKNNTAPTPSTSTHSLYSSETVSGGKAYGYTLPSAWAEGATAYVYVNYCTVSFETNGASSISSQNVGVLCYASEPVEPVIANQIFGGWYSDSDLTDAFDFNNDKVYNDITLYAKWSVKVSIVVNDGGSADPDEEAIVQIGNDLLIKCTPKKDYYVSEITSLKKYNIVDNKDNTYTVENIKKADTIEISFECENLLGSVSIDYDGTPECEDEIGVNTTKVENGNDTLKYQWTRDGKDISGATKETYTLTKNDVGYKIGIKVTSTEKEGTLSSKLPINVLKAVKSAPRTPVLQAKSINSITLEMLEGCEYKMDNGLWQDSNVFSELEPETEYAFYQRYKETDTHNASSPSFSLKVTTNGYSVEEISFAQDGARMQKGDTVNAASLIQYSVKPVEVQNKDVVWASSNEKVAIINEEDGTITALTEGKTIITVTAVDTTNGTFSDTCILQVYDPSGEVEGAYIGSLSGRLINSKGEPLVGYNVTLYSNPVTTKTNDAGEYHIDFVPYTSHTLVVENTNSEEIGRFTINWTLGEKDKAVIDKENNVIDITYTDTTASISMPIQVNNGFDAIEIRSVEGISFTNNEENQAVSKKMYVLILMGIIAACIIGVGYILYIGKIQKEETYGIEEYHDEYYKQLMLEEKNQMNDNHSRDDEN